MNSDYGQVVNCRITEEYDVYIGRPSQFSNPYEIGRDGNRLMVLAKYRMYLADRMITDPRFSMDVMALKGKTLGCWCAPAACHGDILLEVANVNSDVL